MARLTHALSGVTVQVSDETAALLDSQWVPEGTASAKSSSKAAGKSSGKAAKAVELPEGDPTDAWTVPQLKAHAENHGIDLGAAKSKPDILALVTAPADGDETGDGSGD